MKPNVLIIHADQLRCDCIGAYKNEQARTPNLDGFAKGAAVFDNHFCTYPVCTPSRYSLLTGLYPHQHLGLNNRCTLPSGLPTLPRILKENGYHTAAVGKMHFTPTYLNVGFDSMILAEQDGDGRFDDDYHRELMKAGLIDDEDIIDQRPEYRKYASRDYFNSFGAQISSLPEKYHSTSWITSRALDNISGWKPGESNFLMVGYIKPHHPFDPIKRYADMYDPKETDPLPGYTETVPEQDGSFQRGYFDNDKLSETALRKMTAYYYAAITQIDDGIGEILKALESKNLMSDTIVVFTSDHGDYLGFHHMALKSNHHYDPLIHIPLIIRYPDSSHAGERVKALSSNADVAAEILRACSISLPEGIEKTSLFSGRRFVLSEQIFCVDGSPSSYYTLRSAEYKLILNGGSDNGMFFDLKNDPFELHNLWRASEYGALIDEYIAELMRMLIFDSPAGVHLNLNAPVNSPENAADPIRREQMRAYFEKTSRAGKSAERD